MASQELKAERESPRFDISDEEGSSAAMEYLREHGYAVIAGALSPEETDTALRLLWSFLGSAYGMRPDDVASWDKMKGYPNTGILYQDGVGQSELLWFVRGLPRVRKIFELIWGTDRLFTSFDGAGVFRNWSYNEKWRTKAGWYHVDQNPVKRPGLHCVQGLVSLLDAGAAYGNLVVIPGSHKLFPSLGANVRGSGDFVRLNESQLQEFEAKCGPAVVVPCKAGDLVLWDSRVVHCNQPGTQRPPVADEAKGELWQIVRAVCYVCMTPSSKADPAGLRDLVEQRVEAFRQQTTSTHWPHELRVSAKAERGLNPLVGKLNRDQKALIFGASPSEEDETWAVLDDRTNSKAKASKAPVAWQIK